MMGHSISDEALSLKTEVVVVATILVDLGSDHEISIFDWNIPSFPEYFTWLFRGFGRCSQVH